MIHVLHHNDSDGQFAGYSAWRHFKKLNKLDSVIFTAVQYNEPFPLVFDDLTKEDEIYILDFSYKRNTLDPIYEKVGKLVVLDHHETAETELAGAPYALFDMTKSGALLAWEYFFPEEEPPLPCTLVNDYDLHTWAYGQHTAAFEAWLQYTRIGQNWEEWNDLCSRKIVMEQALDKGKLIHELNVSIVDSFLKNPENYVLTSGSLAQGTEVVRINYVIYNGNTVLRNEVAAAFYKKYPVDATIQWRVKNDKVVFSIRAPNPEKFSAKLFSEHYNGGGHSKAASFALPLSSGMFLVQMLMTKHFESINYA